LIYENDMRLPVWSNEVARLSVLHLIEKFLLFHSCDITKNGATRDKSYSEISKDSQLRCGPYEDSLTQACRFSCGSATNEGHDPRL